MNKTNQEIKNNGFISDLAEISPEAKIYPNVYIFGASKIGKGTIIYPNTTINGSEIGENCVVKCSYIEDSVVKNNVSVGPFSHIRPNSFIDNNCKIGNFVEIKNSVIGKGTKVSHLAYVGDADVGESCNIGCGAIFVNYNGKIKSRTIVGDGSFIGSNCNIIAPVVIEKNTYICAGTTLTKNTESGDFVIGRCRELVKKNRAKNYLKELR